jgi:hypothetical protein
MVTFLGRLEEWRARELEGRPSFWTLLANPTPQWYNGRRRYDDDNYRCFTR